MGQILVPVDFSEASLAGVRKAITLAEKREAEVHLVNIITPTTTNKNKSKEMALVSTLNQLMENESKFSQLISDLDCQDLKVRSEIKITDFEKGIKQYINRHDVDLIVVGINGSHTVGDLFCQGRDKKLIEVDCPVEVVKQ